jgi:cyclic beta-1,2-glucan synthetase
MNPANLNKHGRDFALSSHLIIESKQHSLIKIDALHKSIEAKYKYIKKVQEKSLISVPSSSEWILDNYFIIEEELLEVKSALHKKNLQVLPKFKSDNGKNKVQIYEIAKKYLELTNLKVERETLIEYIEGYQKVIPLKTLELWLLPQTLRLNLFENLDHILSDIMEELDTKINIHNKNKKIGKLFQSNKTKARTYIKNNIINKNLNAYELIEILNYLSEIDTNVLEYKQLIEEKLSKENLNIEEFIKAKNSKDLITKAQLGTIVTSIRNLSFINWFKFFEKVSIVEELLNKDTAGVYSKMDNKSKNMYRHVIEHLSYFSKQTEAEVCKQILKLTEKNKNDPRKNHVGYYLIDNGLKEIKKELNFKSNITLRIINFYKDYPVISYLILIFGISFIITGLSSLLLGPSYILLLVFIAATYPAIQLTNEYLTRTLPLEPPPRLKFTGEIPQQYKTTVVIPCMLINEEQIRHLVSLLEQRYIANKDSNLSFGLLADPTDAEIKEETYDKTHNQLVSKLIKELNQKYGNHFYLFIRPRKYNSSEQKWMAWERKRGKLIEFNKYLTQSGKYDFNVKEGALEILNNVKYVITLDEDTLLPYKTARKLIGAMAHPLNRPVIDKEYNIVKQGYAILQPKVSITTDIKSKSFFTKLFVRSFGLDIYMNGYSDVYQDLFKRAIFRGKGIYDVKAVQLTIQDRFPENTLLSHDLIESFYAKTGLISNVSLIEDHPTTYNSFVKRDHRWTRGDWQIIPWLFSKELDPLSKWLILDNVRRSLIQPASALILVLGILNVINIYTAMLIAVPIYFAPFIIGLYRTPSFFKYNLSFFEALHIWAVDFGMKMLQSIVQFLFWLDEAIFKFDAIVRSLYRMKIKKHLLEWTTQYQAESDSTKTSFLRPSVIISFFILGINITNSNPYMVSYIIPLAWILVPFYADFLAKNTIKEDQLNENSIKDLRRYASRIWRFFEENTDKRTNYLPPDNVQEDPTYKIAYRTSPTNIGFYLLSNISAYYLGYISYSKARNNIKNTLNTLNKITKYKGHLFNWYEIENLLPLIPYVSTVDSGNFVAALITTKQFLLNETPEFDEQKYFEAINDFFKSIDLKDAKILSSKKELTLEDINNFLQNHKNSHNYWIGKIHEAVLNIKIGNERKMPNNKEIEIIDQLIKSSSFNFLYDTEKEVFSIGYNTQTQELDLSYYDILMTEARLASYLAIALGQVDEKHWYNLSRIFQKYGTKFYLISWGGTAFEYLLPNLFLPTFENSIFHESLNIQNKIQQKDGKRNNRPWGLSESGYYAFDFEYNYQYKMIGLQDLAIKKYQYQENVISPYSTFLNLHIDKKAAVENLREIENIDGYSKYGFYEAIDFTKTRLDKAESSALVKTYTAHHQGMSLVSIINTIMDNKFTNLFSSNPDIASCLSLLQESTPMIANTVSRAYSTKTKEKSVSLSKQQKNARIFNTAYTLLPRAHIYSNNKISTLINNSGTGYIKHEDTMLNRYYKDISLDKSGIFTFIKDLESSKIWSTTHQPLLKTPDEYHVTFLNHKAVFNRKDDQINVKTEVYIPPEESIEIREINIKNDSYADKEFEITTYCEVGLDKEIDMQAHPAFNKLFIQTQYYNGILISKRKKRKPSDQERYFYQYIVENNKIIKCSFETSRESFIGRNNSIETAQGLHKPLTNTVGTILDPVSALKFTLNLDKNSNKTIQLVSGYADSLEEIKRISNTYNKSGELIRLKKLSNIKALANLKHLQIDYEEEILIQKLISKIEYPNYELKNIDSNKYSQDIELNNMWKFSISGNNKFVLLKINSDENLQLVKTLLKAHEYCRLKNYKFEVVIIVNEKVSYLEEVYKAVNSIIENSLSNPYKNEEFGIYSLRGNELSEKELTTFEILSSIILDNELGTLTEQLGLTKNQSEETNYYANNNIQQLKTDPINQSLIEPEHLEFFNGYGGFKNDGSVYEIKLNKHHTTPMPYSNILANQHFGTLVTESTLGNTWNINSQLNKLTNWTNDPISNDPGEIVYIKDKDSNNIWSATLLPCKTDANYTTEHTQGKSTFKTQYESIETETTVYVPQKDKVKIIAVKIKNNSNKKRNLQLTYYVEWALNNIRFGNENRIYTNYLDTEGILIAQNKFNTSYKEELSYISCNNPISAFTCDRVSFLGRNGNKALPLGLCKSIRSKAGLVNDSCGVIASEVELKAKSETTLVFILGQENNVEAVKDLVAKYRNLETVNQELEKIQTKWKTIIDNNKVSAANRMNEILINNWLLYQTLVGRYYAKTGFYQASGAFGFRDQLQDTLALIKIHPDYTYSQIIRSAQHQFEQGDVMHWWHEHEDMGVRTKITDDLLWLPYAVCKYIKETNDYKILKEQTEYLKYRELTAEEEALFIISPERTDYKEDIYIHCKKAIQRATKYGDKNLPLMGTGDWNDGMDHIGNKGKGQSVWLGFFLYDVMNKFKKIAKHKNDHEFVNFLEDNMNRLKQALNNNAWDGEWFLRATSDEGHLIGSSESKECKIDAISQAWAVISKAAEEDKQIKALKSVQRHLVDKKNKMILLLTPAFKDSIPYPGYIQGYPEGIRENGGQYSHGVAWVVKAFMEHKDFKEAEKLFTMLNPINHSYDLESANKYKNEPYVMSGDVYFNPQHKGRGGWSWYTGSAGWMYTIGQELFKKKDL